VALNADDSSNTYVTG